MTMVNHNTNYSQLRSLHKQDGLNNLCENNAESVFQRQISIGSIQRIVYLLAYVFNTEKHMKKCITNFNTNHVQTVKQKNTHQLDNPKSAMNMEHITTCDRYNDVKGDLNLHSDNNSNQQNQTSSLYGWSEFNKNVTVNENTLSMVEDWDSEYLDDSTSNTTSNNTPWIWKPECRKKNRKQECDVQEDLTAADPTVLSEEEKVNEVEDERKYELVQSHPRKIYVSNINFKTSINRLWQCLEDNFGKVEYCKILKDRRNRSKGRGFARFKDAASVLKAIHLDHEITLDKRVLKIEMATWKRYEESPSEKTNSVDSNENSIPMVESWDDNANDVSVSQHGVPTTSEALDEYTLIHIFSYLTWKERLTLRAVSKKWKAVSVKCWQSMTELNFAGVGPRFVDFQDRNLKRLLKQGCPMLHTIDLSSVSRTLSSQCLEFIGKECQALRKIDISGLTTNNRSIKLFAESCPDLTWIKMQNCHDIGDKSLWSLFISCKKLNYVNLEGNRRITGKCFHVSQKNIHTLVLTDCIQLSDEGLMKIAERWNSVAELYISGCPAISDQGLKAICDECCRLTVFEMSGYIPGISQMGVRRVCQLYLLEELNISRNLTVSDSALEAIGSSCKVLKKLNIQQCWKEVSNLGIAALSNIPTLEELDISYNIKISDISLEAIATHGRLTAFEARGCSLISEEGVSSLLNLCPRLKLLDVCGCQLVTRNLFLAVQNLPISYFHDDNEELNVHVGGTSIEPEELQTFEIPENVHVHFANLCVESFRPDREIFIYMARDSSDESSDYEDEYDEQDQYDLADDYLEYDEPLYEERFNMT